MHCSARDLVTSDDDLFDLSGEEPTVEDQPPRRTLRGARGVLSDLADQPHVAAAAALTFAIVGALVANGWTTWNFSRDQSAYNHIRNVAVQTTAPSSAALFAVAIGLVVMPRTLHIERRLKTTEYRLVELLAVVSTFYATINVIAVADGLRPAPNPQTNFGTLTIIAHLTTGPERVARIVTLLTSLTAAAMAFSALRRDPQALRREDVLANTDVELTL